MIDNKRQAKTITHKNRRKPLELKKNAAGRPLCKPARTGGYWLIDDIHLPRIKWLAEKMKKERGDKSISRQDIVNDAIAAHLDIEGVPEKV
jgi:hypothetical protein